jgi:hypothetical protein
MAHKAYIGLNEENHWTLYYGDGTESERYVLAVGECFEPGDGIRQAMVDLENWAWEHGYELDAPLYSTTEISLGDLIEPEVFDDVFGPPYNEESA